MSIQLPDALENALQNLIQGVAMGPLGARAQSISTAYRQGMGSKKAVPGPADALAYALTRMPATFAAIDWVLDHALDVLPGIEPRSMLDLGAGPGTAAWAASQHWPDLARIILADRHGPFQELARTLSLSAPSPALLAAEFIDQDLSVQASFPRADLVIAAYVLAELEPDALFSFTRRAMLAADQLLVLVEPGTPAGHHRLMIARQTIIDMGAHILAPCPHQNACPMTGDQWCRFAVRLARSRSHRLTKGVDLPFEDEPVSYLVATRHGADNRASARIIGPPQRTKIGITLPLCRGAGLESILVPSRDRAQSAIARRLRWGDAYDPDPA